MKITSFKISKKKILILLLIPVIILLENFFSAIKAYNFTKYIVSSNHILIYKNKKTKLDELAKIYQPLVAYKKKGELFPPVKILYYGIISVNEDELILSYRIIREDEKHPKPIIDLLYKIFRILYFGSRNDIEYIEYKMNLKTGFVRAIRFEEGKLQKLTVKHIKIEITCASKGIYEKRQHNNKDIISTFNIDEHAKDLVFVMETWNGLFKIKTKKKLPENLVSKYLPLSGCLWWDIYHYRMWRRSCGWKSAEE